jgi:hypothetical protein
MMLTKEDAFFLGFIGPLVVLLIMVIFVHYIVRGKRIWLIILALIYPITNIMVPLYIFITYAPDEPPVNSIILVLVSQFVVLGPGQVITEFRKYWKLNGKSITHPENKLVLATIRVDLDQREWLISRLRVNFFLFTIPSLLLYILYGIYIPMLRDIANYFTFLGGLCAGIYLSSIIFLNPVGNVNPRKDLFKSTLEIDQYLRPIWKNIHRKYYWFANIPYALLPLTLWLFSEKQPPQSPLGLFLLGGGVSFLLCAGITSLYLFLQLCKVEE